MLQLQVANARRAQELAALGGAAALGGQQAKELQDARAERLVLQAQVEELQAQANRCAAPSASLLLPSQRSALPRTRCAPAHQSPRVEDWLIQRTVPAPAGTATRRRCCAA